MSRKWFFWVILPVFLVCVLSLGSYAFQDRLMIESRITHYETWMPQVDKRLERIEHKLDQLLERGRGED